MRGGLRGLTGLVLAAGLLAGCGSGPSQIGAAAIVGEATVPVDQVQATLRTVIEKEPPEVEAALVQGDQLGEVSRQILTIEIQDELVTVAAQREGLSVNEGEVTALVDSQGGAQAASAGTIFDAGAFRERQRDRLLLVELGRKYLPRLVVTVDFTTAQSGEAAQQQVRALTEAGEQGARQLIQADVVRGMAAGVDQELAAAENPTFAAAPVFGVPPGTVVAFQQDQQGASWLVMVVTDVELRDPVGIDVDSIETEILEATGIRRLAPIAADLGVRINPRYGVWDPLSLAVVPGESEIEGFIAPLRQRPRL